MLAGAACEQGFPNHFVKEGAWVEMFGGGEVLERFWQLLTPLSRFRHNVLVNSSLDYCYRVLNKNQITASDLIERKSAREWKANMKKLFLILAVAAIAAAGASTARAGVAVSIGIPAPVVVAPAPRVYYAPPPVVYAPPAPVVVAPAPVYCAPPAPVYYPPTAYYAPAPVVRFGFGFGHPYYHHYHRW